jgi:hypothetical protein
VNWCYCYNRYYRLWGTFCCEATSNEYHGLHDVLGITAPGDGKETVDCSEAVTCTLQAGGLDIFPDFIADNVAPVNLLKTLQPRVVA